MGNNYSSNAKQSYFKLLNKTLKKNQDKNRINQNNIEYSFITKSLPNPYNEYLEEPNITMKSRNISWKSYLILILRYLSLNKKYLWAGNLEIFIQNNKFASQYKYLSLFFYEDFKISSMPNISSFKNDDKYSYQKSNLFSRIENEDNEFDNKSININDKKGYKETIGNIYNETQVCMSNELLGSLASMSFDEINSFLIENEPTLKYKLGKEKLKKYINIFKNHLCHKDHPINIILNKFTSVFKPIIINTCEDLKNHAIIGNYDDGKNIIYQLQEFMKILQVATKLFYSKCISYDFFQDEKDEFINLISFLVFNTGDIYKNIYALLKIMNSSKITLFTNKIKQFGVLDPEEMGVKEKFCLNEKTKDYMEKYKKNQINIINKKPELKSRLFDNEKNELQNIKEDDENDKERQLSDNFFKRSKLNLNINLNLIDMSNNTMPKKKLNLFGDLDDYYNKKNVQQKNTININTDNDVDTNLNINLNLKVSDEENKNKKNQFLQKFSRRYSSVNFSIENENNVPYHEEIETLETISKCKTPLEKMITIASISSIIINSIYNFWKPIEELVKPSFLNVEADEIIKIFTYIVYTSKMSELVVHLDFIKYFTISATKKTMIGYYYSIVQGALNTILEATNIDSF